MTFAYVAARASHDGRLSLLDWGGGLVWAGVVIVTRYDIGILAWLVGAATGYAVHRLGGGTVTTADRAV